jgi:hypothetical protein
MSKKMVKSWSGRSFEVDASAEACGEFGFKSGDRVRQSSDALSLGLATVVGVTADPRSGLGEVLWCAFDKNGGEVTFCDKNFSRSLKLITDSDKYHCQNCNQLSEGGAICSHCGTMFE